jgi:hypothetical protein
MERGVFWQSQEPSAVAPPSGFKEGIGFSTGIAGIHWAYYIREVGKRIGSLQKST